MRFGVTHSVGLLRAGSQQVCLVCGQSHLWRILKLVHIAANRHEVRAQANKKASTLLHTKNERGTCSGQAAQATTTLQLSCASINQAWSASATSVDNSSQLVQTTLLHTRAHPQDGMTP